MRKYRRKILLVFLLVFFMVPDVMATKLSSSGEYHFKFDLTTGELGGASNGGSMYNKKIDGATAYCAALRHGLPNTGTKYYLVSGTSNYNRDNYVAGQIISIGKKKYSGKNEYLYIQEALTCYFSPVHGSATYRTKDTHKYGFCSKNSKVKSLISTAQSYVNEFQFSEGTKTGSLPQLKIETSSQVIGNVTANSNGNYNYSSSEIVISGIVTTAYGGDRSKYYSSTVPSYVLNISGGSSGSTVELCNAANQCFANGATNIVDGTYYLRITNGGFDGGNVAISLSGSNSSKYPSANFWDPKISGDQILVTYVSPLEITRAASVAQSFSYAPVDRYSAQIEKIDDKGVPLTGAKLKLYIADANEQQIGNALCSTDGTQTSCSKTDIKESDGYMTGNKLCYTEEQSPSGYKKIDTKCSTINLAENKTSYYEYELQSDDTWKEKEITADIFGYYTQFGGAGVEKRNVYTLTNGTVIYDLSDVIYEYSYTNSSGKTTNYYSTVSITEENGGVYRHGTVTQDEEGNDVYEFNDPVVRIPVINSSSSDLKEVYAYLSDESTKTYTILELDEGSEVQYHVKSPTETVKFVKTYKSSDTKKVCWLTNEEGNEIVSDNSKYCDTNYYATKVATSNGSVHISVVNTLNSIKISKRAITGDEELPGAKLALYTANSDGTCTKELVKSSNSSALKFTYKTYDPVESVGGESGEGSSSGSTDSGTSGTGADDGVEDSTDDTSGVGMIEKNYLKDGLSWVSTDAPVTISGLAAGKYCLVEEIPTEGYIKTFTTTKFTINSDGTLDEKSISGEYKDGVFIVRNRINNLSISKTDIVTTKELPGAILKICKAEKGENGTYKPIIATGEANDQADTLDNCVVASLADGSTATWTSEEEPHKISGLPAGDYALVEVTAPNGYSTAEVIYFIMNDAGKLTDTEGKLLSDNKIVMHDAPIVEIQTGMLSLYLVIGIVLVAISVGLVTYFYFNKKNNHFPNDGNKVRRRRLHKIDG